MRILLLLPLACLITNEIMAQNVGIGTATPAARLDVKTTLNYVMQLNGSAPMYAGIFENDVYRGYFGSYSGAAEDVDFGTGSGNTSGKLHFTIQSVPKLTIDAAGNVGIGITNPGARLEVAGQVKITGGSPGAGKVLTSNASGLATWETPAAGLWTSSGGNIYNSNAENVGIGVSNPIGKLEVDAGILNETSVRFKSSSDYGIRQWYMMGNDLNTALVISRFGPLLGGNLFGMPIANLSAIFTNDLGVNALAIGTKNNIPLVLGTANTARIFIDGSGNVGMGTATPGTKLEVAGQVKITGGSPGAGKVLTSDADGLASWATPTVGAHNHFGQSWEGSAPIGLTIRNNQNTGKALAAVAQSVSGTNIGVEGTVVGNNGIGVWGTVEGQNPVTNYYYEAGVAGNANTKIGVYGQSTFGNAGVFKTMAEASVKATILAEAAGHTALELNNGFIKVSGTNKTAFTVTGSAGNTSGHILTLSYANQSASDIVMVTHNYNPGGVGGTYHNIPVGVYWNGTNWTIYSEDASTPMLGKAFNVLVIKQ